MILKNEVFFKKNSNTLTNIFCFKLLENNINFCCSKCNSKQKRESKPHKEMSIHSTNSLSRKEPHTASRIDPVSQSLPLSDRNCASAVLGPNSYCPTIQIIVISLRCDLGPQNFILLLCTLLV